MKRKALVMAALGLSFFVQFAQADWTPAKRLTWNSGMSGYPAITVGSPGHIHVVWFDNTPGNYEIYHKKSTDGGVMWATSQRLSWNSGNSQAPAIAADSSGHLHAVWSDSTIPYGEVYYKKSTDAGASWAAAKRLTWTPGISGEAAIAVDPSGHLHLIWNESTPGNFELFYKKSTDGGSTWTSGQQLTWTEGDSYVKALIVAASGELYLVWEDETPGNFEIYLKKSTDGGAAWTAAQRLTWTEGDSELPALAVDPSGDLHLVWEENRTTSYEIYYKRSTDGGVTWTKSNMITWTGGWSYSPAVAADSLGNIHVVWSDDTPGHTDMYYRMSADGGATWSASQRLSWTSGNSFRPAVAIDASDNLLLVWDDFTPGNGEIYFKKGK